MITDSPIFVISLDFELYWGVRESKRLIDYYKNIRNVEKTISKTLDIFQKNQIHATWATVGLLFADNKQELGKYIPNKKSLYTNENLNNYTYIKKHKHLNDIFHFAPNIVKEIMKYDYQEIGSHTFSHYYCLEDGQTIYDFTQDLKSFKRIQKKYNIKAKSLVFPRNQLNKDYINTLKDEGIMAFRGNQKSWLYRGLINSDESITKKIIRYLDNYFVLTGQNTFKITEINKNKPYNIPASRFLRPYSKKLFLFEKLKLKRITDSIIHAAKNDGIMHLWWHPHNMGSNIINNFKNLNYIIQIYKKMNLKYGMQSMNMNEITEKLDEK